MNDIVISLGDDAEIILNEPDESPQGLQALAIFSLLEKELANRGPGGSAARSGSLLISLGRQVYHYHYQLRMKRILSALALYSEAIEYIESHLESYDQRLAAAAIRVLRETYLRKLS